MRTYPLNEARAEFSKVIERALAGEPQRVTRYGKEAVIVVSETDWLSRPWSAPTLGNLLADFAERPDGDDELFESSTLTQSRGLGSDFDGE
jgi:prevent-host-death family protein